MFSSLMGGMGGGGGGFQFSGSSSATSGLETVETASHVVAPVALNLGEILQPYIQGSPGYNGGYNTPMPNRWVQANSQQGIYRPMSGSFLSLLSQPRSVLPLLLVAGVGAYFILR